MAVNRTGRQLSLTTRRELIEAVGERYRGASRTDKQKILDEFTEITGFHRKHAIRTLRKRARQAAKAITRSRVYDEAVVQALTMLWEAADRICGKRLKQAIPVLLEAMERHGHLELAPEVRERVLQASAATIDRLLKPVREVGKQGRRRSTINTRFGRASRSARSRTGMIRRPDSSRWTWWLIAANRSRAVTFIVWCLRISHLAGPRPAHWWYVSRP